jgi:hypothetical protein
MESLAIVFVIGLFFYLNAPREKPKPKDPWEEMGKAIGTALKTLFPGGEKKSEGGKKDDNNELLRVIILSALIGLLVLYAS